MDFLKLLLNTLLVFHLFHFSTSSVDTITANQSIKDGDVIVSEQKIFALGFFSPGKSPKRYVGIWYHQISGYQIPEKTVVWVANRDRPISGKIGVLSINTHGNLVLYETNQSIVPVWSTNVSFTSLNGTVAQLSDSGNLVLRLVENNSKKLWQSFDYPTDTLLPLMKLGLDRKTGLNRILRSWKSLDDPGFGEYSRVIDPTGNPQLITYKGSNKWWRTGSWTGKRWSGVPETLLSYDPDPGFTFVNNQNEVYLMFYAVHPPGLTRLIVSVSGHVCRFRWESQEKNWDRFWCAPNDLPCDYYGHCGANSNCNQYQSNVDECVCLPGFEPKYPQGDSGNGSRGCMRKRGTSSCQRGRRFIKVPQVKVPDTSVTHVDMRLDLKECKNNCLSNCSCIAYTSAQPETDGVMGCLTYHGDQMMDTRTYPNFGQDLYVRVLDESDGSLGKKAIVAIAIASLFAMFLMIVATIWFFKKKRRERASESTISLTSANLGESFGRKEQNLQVLDLRTIAAATNNFSVENKLGEGGFGPVYKGQLPNGQEIAVKRLSQKSGQGISEFKNEVLLIAKLQHRNLVRLLGYCIEQGEKMLIYEFLPNKSLDYFIFDQSRKLLLDWKMRFEIILGIARGILYLHQDSRLKVIHRDLKASNILLDEEMQPKISDFGTAKIFGRDESQGNTKKVVGTHGYMPPEYVIDGIFSTKSDIFSFGVIVLEIISGRKNRSIFLDDPSSYLIQYTWELWKNGKALEIVDSCMVDQFPANEVLRCIQVGLLCVQDNAKDRPNLSTAIFMLSNETMLPSPKKPTFVLKKNEPETSISRTTYSINEVTITTLDAR